MNMRGVIKHMSLLILLMGTGAASAQQIRLDARIDSNSIMIGDHVKLSLSAEFPDAYTVKWPVFGDTLTANLEMIRLSPLDTLPGQRDGMLKFHQVLTLTCFDSGYFEIPSIPFGFTRRGDTQTITEYTRTIGLMVNVPVVDTAQAIRDIKDPLGIPMTWREMLPWILGGAGVLLLMLGVIYIIIRKRKKKPVFGAFAKPDLPAHIKALKALEALRGKRWWQQGKVKEYHSELSDIIRLYLWDRFNLQAPEMTTGEVLDHVADIPEISKEAAELMRLILQLADMVKFARFQPLPDEHDQSMRAARSFVELTAPAEPTAAEGNEKEVKMSEEDITK